MLSSKERFLFNVFFLVFFWGVITVFSLYNKLGLPGEWIYRAATTKNLSFAQTWKYDFEKGTEINKEFQKNGK